MMGYTLSCSFSVKTGCKEVMLIHTHYSHLSEVVSAAEKSTETQLNTTERLDAIAPLMLFRNKNGTSELASTIYSYLIFLMNIFCCLISSSKSTRTVEILSIFFASKLMLLH